MKMLRSASLVLVTVFAALNMGCVTAEKKIFVLPDGRQVTTEPTDMGSGDSTSGAADSAAAPGFDTAPAPPVDDGRVFVPTDRDAGSTPPLGDPGSTTTTADPGPSTPPDPGPPPGCTGDFTIEAFAPETGDGWARFNQSVEVRATLGGTVQPTLAIEVSPPDMLPYVDADSAAGTATLHVDQWSGHLRTTEVAFRLTATIGPCTLERTTTVKVLGDLWVTVDSPYVVQRFRSDGTFISQGIPST